MTLLDTLGMGRAMAAAPEQLLTSVESARDVELPALRWVDRVVITGAGTAGLAGEALVALCAPRSAVPLVAVRSGELPGYVGPTSLVVAVSFSGGTEETLAAAAHAMEVGARLVVIAGGGELASRASLWQVPVVPIVGDLPDERVALGAMLTPLLVVAERAGLYSGVAESVAQAATELAIRREQLVVPGGPAEVIARQIGRTIPLVHGSSGIGAVCARHWASVINANAKTPAWWSVHPDLHYDELAGWGQHGDVTRQIFTLVALRYHDEHPSVARAFPLVNEALREVVSQVVELRAAGTTPLSELLDLCLVGDAVSLALATSAGLDPGPVPAIEELHWQLYP